MRFTAKRNISGYCTPTTCNKNFKMPYKNGRKKVARRVPRRRLQTYTAKQKEQILRNAATSIAGGYASLRRRSFTPATASDYMKNRRKKSSSSSESIEGRGSIRSGGMQDYVRSSARMGYKKSKATLVKKLTTATVNTTVYTMHNYGAWNRGEGILRLAANQPGLAGTALDMPIHLWDLTAAPQGSGTSLLRPAVFYNCQFTNETATGSVQWQTHVNGAVALATGLDQRATLGSINYNPTATYVTTQREGVTAGFEGGPGATSFLEKVNASLILNGPQQRATKWLIQVVQLSEEVIPGANPDSSNVNTAFWQAMAKPFGYSPLETGPRMELRKHIKVLKSLEYLMDSPENSEDHLTARMRHVNFTMYLNRKLNYRWSHVNDLVAINAADVPIDSGTASFACHVHPKARVFLMLRALCTFTGPSVAATNLIYPSYDMKLDITHKSMD